MNTKDLFNLYPDFTTWYGPFTRKGDNRQHICLYNSETKKKQTVSFSKILLEIKIGRRLVGDETCDHIDNNALNDNPDNLQVLSRAKNAEKSATKHDYTKRIELTCANCNKKYSVTRVTYLKHKSRFPNTRNCCSRVCRGQITHKQR